MISRIEANLTSVSKYSFITCLSTDSSTRINTVSSALKYDSAIYKRSVLLWKINFASEHFPARFWFLIQIKTRDKDSFFNPNKKKMGSFLVGQPTRFSISARLSILELVIQGLSRAKNRTISSAMPAAQNNFVRTIRNSFRRKKKHDVSNMP